MTCQDSDQDSLMAEEIEVSTEMHVLDKVLDEEELDQNMSIGEQEFGEIERGKDELKDKKYMVKVLPDGLTVDGARLLFGRAPKQNDAGVYEYVVNNGVGTRKVEHNITVTGKGKWAKLLLYFAKI
ncbi:uncharacterized protein LOC110508160 [Oncorhynchus mykiss]|uniref:uncharacterized protein LOC110508160 n=1 Tax=Oncorhynchus mykiss TaxID=8022 RepID=UPI0018784FDB|nr:uncharacterized protein LOC110508160 [Oncorhynchus mykiss]